MNKFTKENYSKLCRKVAWFDNMITFHQAWSAVPHSKVASVLYDADENKFKIFKDHNGKDYQVTVMMMFLYGIAPQSEDKQNQGQFRIEIRKKHDNETLQKLWETLVLDCVTGNIPGLDEKDDGLTGVRFIQKNNKNNWNELNNYRVEIWTKNADEKNEVNQKIKTYLETNIIQDVLGSDPSESHAKSKP